jgi:ABC-2 type transport system ATP-binding protein
MIEAEKLTKKFRNKIVVDALDFFIEEGRIFGLLGSNGAGKTTTINLLTGLLLPTSGCARINGLDVVRDIQKVRRYISLVPQTVSLYEELSIFENLEFFGGLYLDNDRELKKRIQEICEIFELTELKNNRVSEISGGFKRRVSFAAALIPRPKVIFLDEPLVGVDLKSNKIITSYLKSLKNLTTILATHSLKDAEELCNQIMVLDAGKKLFSGSPEEMAKFVDKKIGEKVIVEFNDISVAKEKLKVIAKEYGDVFINGNFAEVQLFNSEKLFDLVKFIEVIKNEIINIEIKKPLFKDLYEKLLENKKGDSESN